MWRFVAPRGRNALVYALSDPGQQFEVPRDRLQRKDVVKPRWENYTEPVAGSAQTPHLNFLRYFWNSTFVTVVATLIRWWSTPWRPSRCQNTSSRGAMRWC